MAAKFKEGDFWVAHCFYHPEDKSTDPECCDEAAYPPQGPFKTQAEAMDTIQRQLPNTITSDSGARHALCVIQIVDGAAVVIEIDMRG